MRIGQRVLRPHQREHRGTQQDQTTNRLRPQCPEGLALPKRKYTEERSAGARGGRHGGETSGASAGHGHEAPARRPDFPAHLRRLTRP
jgi:hypothetical protein